MLFVVCKHALFTYYIHFHSYLQIPITENILYDDVYNYAHIFLSY